MPRYDVMGTLQPEAGLTFIRSVTNRTHAIEIADDLVERKGWWSAHVATERRLVTYSRHSEPTWCGTGGYDLPLHKGRAFLNAIKGEDERTLYFKTDEELWETHARFFAQDYDIPFALSIREVEAIIHDEMLDIKEELNISPVPF